MIGGAHSIHFGPARVRSLADGIARVLARYLEHAIPDQSDAGFCEAEARVLGPATAGFAAEPSDTHGSPLAASRGVAFCPPCRRAAFISSMGCMQCTECGFREC